MSKQPATLAAALQLIAKDLPTLLSAQEVIAALQRERYLALIRQGFTEQQALELTAKVSLTI